MQDIRITDDTSQESGSVQHQAITRSSNQNGERHKHVVGSTNQNREHQRHVVQAANQNGEPRVARTDAANQIGAASGIGQSVDGEGIDEESQTDRSELPQVIISISIKRSNR